MMLGLIGAHRCGKTTTAKAYAEKMEWNLIETTTSQVFKDLGHNPSAAVDFTTRLDIQEQILLTLDKQWASHDPKVRSITDRTPLDLLAYTMADINGSAISELDQVRLKRYTEACFATLTKRFSLIVLVQPGIPVVAAEGKASLSAAYIEHMNSLMLGLSCDERTKVAHFYLPRATLDLNDRLAAITFAVNRSTQMAMAIRENEALH